MSAPKKKRWIASVLRWGVAIAGIAYVVSTIRLHDRVRIQEATGEPGEVLVWNDAQDKDASFLIVDGTRTVKREELWTLADRSKIKVPDPTSPGGLKECKLLAVRPVGPIPGPSAEVIYRDPATGKPVNIPTASLPPKERPVVTYPLVERGLTRMVREAEWQYLALACAVMCISYFLTTYRWHSLLKAQEIPIGMGKTFSLNMVGAFYNSFMPGSTGGDLAKAYYASKYTTHRTRAVLTVIVDRIIGVLALLVLGGVMATVQWEVPECRKVAIIAGAILLVTAAGLLVFYQPTLRRRTGLDWLLKKLPMQTQIQHMVHAMEIYGQQPKVLIWALVCSLPVHITTIISSTLSGKAFHLPLGALDYWVIVPVVTLVGAIPISPQGAGVMEYFAVQLTHNRGVTVAQAFVWVMSLRLNQMFWNLLAGIFVFKGGYHAPTEAEQHELDMDEPANLASQMTEERHPADYKPSQSP